MKQYPSQDIQLMGEANQAIRGSLWVGKRRDLHAMPSQAAGCIASVSVLCFPFSVLCYIAEREA